MANTNQNCPREIMHDIEVAPDSNGNKLYRQWGYSVLVSQENRYVPTSKCDFCKIEFELEDVYETTCYSGGAVDFLLKQGINNSYSPENKTVTFFCCKKCMPKITSLIQMQRIELRNHENLSNVVSIMNFIHKK